MSDFNAKYTQANVAEGAATYDQKTFLTWLHQLQKDTEISLDLAVGIMTALLCAQRRGDAVGALFQDVVEAEDNERVNEVFATVKEAIALSAAFVGLPNTMPACFGVIAVLKKRGIQEVTSRTRPDFGQFDYITLGQHTFESIYRGVGNLEVGQMVAQYLPDMSHYATTAIFGYLLGGCKALNLKDAELIVASAIIGLDATRQARSHGKAALGQGNSIQALEAIDAVAQEVGRWNGKGLRAALDVPQLYEELQNELARLKSIEQKD